ATRPAACACRSTWQHYHLMNAGSTSMSSTTQPTSLSEPLPIPSPSHLTKAPLDPGSRPNVLKRGRRLSGKLLLGMGVIGLLIWGGSRWLLPAGEQGTEITATVTLADRPIIVTERGELESSKTLDVRCEVEGHQNKIVEILPEGTR